MATYGEGEIEERLRMLAEQSIEHAVALFDPEGRFGWWSPGAERIFGFTADEILGQPSAVIFTEEDRARGIPEHEISVATEYGLAHDDRWQRRRDGSRIWVAGMLIPLRGPGGELRGFGKIMRNRTDLKEQLETLRNEAQALAQQVQRKDLFLSTLSHELRNPMAPLSNAVGIIRMSGPLDPGVDYAVKVIERQVELLRRLVDDLLDLTRIGAGKIELRRRQVPIHEVLERALDTARSAIAARDHRIEWLVEPAPIIVDADVERLAQVFVNLLTNAVKYTPAGGRIQVSGTTEGPEAVVRVADNGVGIAPDVLPRIFDMFTQADSAQAMAPGGLGIGLSLVRDLVRQHGGSVQARSDGLGKGSEFTIRLPLAAPE